MKRILGSLLALSLLAGAPAFAAPPHHDDHGPDRRDDNRHDRGDHDRDRHDDRRDDHRPHHHARGEHLERGHWGERVSDYHRHGLKKPSRGQEWRKVDNQYLLVTVATGVIASVLAATR